MVWDIKAAEFINTYTAPEELEYSNIIKAITTDAALAHIVKL